MPGIDEGSVEDLARLLGESRRAVIFTGAGMSTESGIPDFRSPGGVWSRMKPIMFQDFVADETMRREAWNRAFSGVAGWVGAEPNQGHYAVARLVARGKVSSVITQNVDNLHQTSGVPAEKVLELHGNASFATCLECGLRHELDVLKQGFLGTGEIPMCRNCGGLVKVATISFGQAMPEDMMRLAEIETRAADLFIVLGSSLVVFPAAGFPVMAKRNGARLVIVNRDPTDMDDMADLVLNTDIGPVMSRVAPPD
ncbi:MAG TPA: Sir2 family NAD-dependent protein deacetylase [Alphaproteobacteria bacterium]|jgi:NAD-dependent deacetylase|nr:Sir2 family NAD-dependent protein deacetylase [Alphaproteobacteria bacterium]